MRSKTPRQRVNLLADPCSIPGVHSILQTNALFLRDREFVENSLWNQSFSPTAGPKTGPIRENSLYFPCTTGNSPQRQVRGRHPPPPASAFSLPCRFLSVEQRRFCPVSGALPADDRVGGPSRGSNSVTFHIVRAVSARRSTTSRQPPRNADVRTQVGYAFREARTRSRTERRCVRMHSPASAGSR